MISYDKLLWSREDIMRASKLFDDDLLDFLDDLFEPVDLPIVAFRLKSGYGCPFYYSDDNVCVLGDDRPLMCHAFGPEYGGMFQ